MAKKYTGKVDHDVYINRFKTIRSIGEEIVQDNDLLALLKNKEQPIVYDGFEPSGRMHIAQGLLRAINVNKYLKAGCKFKFWIADWFALLNHKLDGDLKKIRNAGKLMIETWKACGMDVDNPNIEFLWSSDEINAKPMEYWLQVLDIATKFNLKRIKRCTPIMGVKDEDEEEKDGLSMSQMMYPVMQAADVFFLKVDICSLGMDQRKVNMLCREYCDKINKKLKPIMVSHHMLMGLDGSDKMSKSNPDNAIFMNDSPDDIRRKLKKAFCQPKNIEVNPILEYVKYIVFEMDETFLIERPEKHGGNLTYTDYNELESDFAEGFIHPTDLKKAATKCIIRYLKPVQQHFATNLEANRLHKTVKSYKLNKKKQ